MQTGQNSDHAVKVLNGLIETTLDSANGYREAAEHVSATNLKTDFAQRSSRRESLVRRLQEEVRSFGGQPESDQSVLGKMHNKFVDLKNAVTGGSDKAVVDEVERGEDVIKAKFERAANDAELPMECRTVIQSAYAEIKADHDSVSQLKRGMH